MFVLNTSSKPYDMNAIDTKTRNEWVSGTVKPALSGTSI
jgi:hypothetical protein